MKIFKNLGGADQPYPPTAGAQQRWQCAVDLFSQLPADERQKIGIDNVKRIYRLQQ